MKITAERIPPAKSLLPTKDLRKLIKLARSVETVELVETQNDLPAEGLMKLAEDGKAFEFLDDFREDIYNVKDLKVRYK